MKRILMALLPIFILLNCDKPQEKEDRVVEGLKPVYISLEDITYAESLPAEDFGTLGKIVSTGDLIFINEQFKGIHVIDNTNPLNPTNLYFWKISGNINFTIKGNYLYADNTMDLLTIDIADPADIKLINRIENIHSDVTLSLPDEYTGFFECVDYSKGIVTDWERTTLTNPKCRR